MTALGFGLVIDAYSADDWADCDIVIVVIFVVVDILSIGCAICMAAC